MADKHLDRARHWFDGVMQADDGDLKLLAEQFREVEREAQRDMVPLSADGRSVFIDGMGEVQLKSIQDEADDAQWENERQAKLREVARAGDALREAGDDLVHETGCMDVTELGDVRYGLREARTAAREAIAAYDKATEGVPR